MNIFNKIINHFKIMREIKRIETELNSYTDRELHDMGICREDIWFIARESV